MKLQCALIFALIFSAGPALAQTSSRDMKGGISQPQPTAQHDPATPATPAQQAAGAKPEAKATEAEKVDPAKEAAIRHLLEVTDASKMTDTVSNGITQQVHKVMSQAISPDRLQKFMETFNQKFSVAAPSSAVTDAVVPLYARNFSMEDIQGLIKFFESPLGQRMVKTLPEVEQQAQVVGMRIDETAAIGVLRGMTDEYAELKRLLPPDRSAPEAAPATTPAPAISPAPAPGLAAAAKPAPVPVAHPAPGSVPAPKAAPAPPQQ
ncbi:MAG: DUF2059 domain-containing protein [Candidatus Acidiferrales bacterium]